jgi:ParB/RepB/Spo0J family partition protein
MLTTLPVDAIDPRPDARPIDAGTVSALAESIAQVGLINPVRVRAAGDRYELIAGAHRLAAHRNLGLVEIQCDVVEDGDEDAELAMIDENLCRAELGAADRAKYTARRKAIYLSRHPETARGKARAKEIQKLELSDRVPSFVNNTAALTGKSASSISAAALRGEKIIDEVINLVRGTKLDTEVYLDSIKGLPPNEQVRAVKRDLAERRPVAIKRKVVRIADAPLDDEDAQERQVAALMSAWNKASAEARQEFLERIDVPVMDRSAA